jgi:hypothetical protein
MNTLKAIFSCALLATVPACAGAESTDHADVESEAEGGESEVGLEPQAPHKCEMWDQYAYCCPGYPHYCCWDSGAVYCW